MDVRHEGWSLGAVGRPVIEAEPMRTVYQVRDEQIVPLDAGQDQQGRGSPRGILAQSALEVGNAFAGVGFGLFRFVVGLCFGGGLLGVVVMGLYWLITQHPNSIRYGLVSLAVMFVASMIQFASYGAQGRLTAWVAKGGRRAS